MATGPQGPKTPNFLISSRKVPTDRPRFSWRRYTLLCSNLCILSSSVLISTYSLFPLPLCLCCSTELHQVCTPTSTCWASCRPHHPASISLARHSTPAPLQLQLRGSSTTTELSNSLVPSLTSLKDLHTYMMNNLKVSDKNCPRPLKHLSILFAT